MVTVPPVIPEMRQNTIIPLQINLDMFMFFKDRGYGSFFDLAFVSEG